MTDEAVRLKAEVRELQEALAAERAKPVQVREVVKPDPKVVAERDQLRRKARELQEALAAEQRRVRELARYLEGMKRGRNDQ